MTNKYFWQLWAQLLQISPLLPTLVWQQHFSQPHLLSGSSSNFLPVASEVVVVLDIFDKKGKGRKRLF